jgi:uncharacterized protein (DUF433 family)
VRIESTGSDVVTWGEFVETRLLSEYRNAGAPMVRLRPAVEQLRAIFDRRYPLAHARPFTHVEGLELVLRAQEEVGLDRELQIVVVARNGQVALSDRARRFVDAAEFGKDDDFVHELRPDNDVRDVVINPLRQFGAPDVRSVPTDEIAEQIRAGDPIETVAELYGLERDLVEAAVRFELRRTPAAVEDAA